MEVVIGYEEDMGFYIMDETMLPISAMIFADYDSALDYCDDNGYVVATWH